jgi:hypothetical protein
MGLDRPAQPTAMSDPKSKLSTRVEVFTRAIGEVQPDLARRLMLPQTPRFLQRVALHREQVQGVLRAVVAAHGFRLHSLMAAEWDGASSLKVLAVQGRTLQLPLLPAAAPAAQLPQSPSFQRGGQVRPWWRVQRRGRWPFAGGPFASRNS